MTDPFSDPPPRPGPAAGVVAGVAALLVVAYPIALDAALVRFGVRPVAVVLLFLTPVSLVLRSRGFEAAAAGGVPSAAIAACLVAAALTRDALYLRLVPALVYAGLAGFFAASLRGPDSIIERTARWMIPQTPVFVRSYCRIVTGLWAAIFAASAVAIGGFALAGSVEGWRTTTSRTIWLAMLGFSAVEFLVRKSRFRYYARGGPFERFWSRLFPPEATARGRRSAAYIVEQKAILASQQAAQARRAQRAEGERSPVN